MKVNQVEIQLIKSPIGYNKKQKDIVTALGLKKIRHIVIKTCLLYTSPSPRDRTRSRMPSSA